MNTYLLNYANAENQVVEANDMDSAIWAGETMHCGLRYGDLKSVEFNGQIFWMAEYHPDHQPEPTKLPSRRIHGLTLTYDEDTCGLFINFFGYSASIGYAETEGYLYWCGNGHRDDLELTDKQMRIIDEWAARESEYYEKNNWKVRND
jgi:hypothetical protein